MDRRSAEHRLPAACLAQACGLSELAGRLLDQAGRLRMEVAPYRNRLGDAALAQGVRLLDEKQLAAAEEIIAKTRKDENAKTQADGQ